MKRIKRTAQIASILLLGSGLAVAEAQTPAPLQRSPKMTHLCSQKVIHSENTTGESNLESETRTPCGRRPG